MVKIEKHWEEEKMDPRSNNRLVDIRNQAVRFRPFFFMLAAALLVFVSIQATRRNVVLVVDGESRLVATFSQTVAGLLDEAGITAGKWDKLSHSPGDALRRGMVIEYTPAFPVTVYADGDSSLTMVADATVSQVLDQLGIALEEPDRTEPTAEQRLVPGDDIRVIRVEKVLMTERTELPFREIRRGNPSLDRGENRVLQKGRAGVREDTVEITLENGREVATVILHSEMIRPRQDRVVEYGENTVLSRGGRTVVFSRVFRMSATAYCAGTEASGCPISESGRSVCTGSNNDGITATGVRAVAGTGQESHPHLVAVDPRVIPLGSRLYIDGYGFAVAVDTGSAIKGNRIDLLLPSHEAARRFGRRSLRVYLLPR
jgi:resuscitation-promoting factor RpfB